MWKVEFCSLEFEGGVPNVESQCIGELNCEGQNLGRLHLEGEISSYVLESSSARISSIFALNLLVANANLMVAETISCISFQLCNDPFFFSLAQPPSVKDKSPYLLAFLTTLRRGWRCSSHQGHLNKKWSTDSGSRP